MGKRGVYLLPVMVQSVGKMFPRLPDEYVTDREIIINAYVADTDRIEHASGAGDTAVAAFLSAILDGESPERAVKYAAAAGRDKLYCDDIYKDMPDWKGLSEELSSETNELVVLK